MRAAALVLAAGLAACVAVPVERWREAPHAPVPGDLVRVETRKGARHVFRVYKVEERAFLGVARNGKAYRVPYAALASLEVRSSEMAWVPVPVAPLHGLRPFPGY